ncbi:MAG: carboxypeptidase regulatory-like domain-containing protein [bacterium]
MKMLRHTLILLCITTTAFPYTSIGGGKGLLRVLDAQTEETGLNVALNLFGRNPTYYPDERTERSYIGDLIAPTLHYTPIASRYVGAEIFGAWGGIFQYAKIGDKAYDIGLHDLKAGAKLSIPYLPVLKLGGAASYTFRFRGQPALPYYWTDQTAIPLDTLTWTGLVTLRFQDLVPPAPNLILNYGKSGNWTNYGTGLELAAEGLALFAELTSRQPENSNGIFDTDSGIVRLTPGVRLGSPRGFALSLGYTFSLTEGIPNEVILGMNIATPFFRKPATVYGQLNAQVIDASTQHPLVATVEFPETPKLKPITTDASGLVAIKKMPVGVVKVKIASDGYRPLETFVNVETKPSGPIQFKLHPLVTYGILSGTVSDARTGKPLGATITSADGALGSIPVDPTTGAFRKDNLPTGTYTITAQAESYFPATATVTIEENRVTNQSFQLTPTTVKSIVTGVVTDRGTDKPLSAKITFKNATDGTVAADISNDPNTGVYTAELPPGPYALIAHSEGYIDQTAALVIEEGKPAKYNFALVKVGTAVTLKGVYFDFNKATLKFPESQEALQAAYQILKDNPTIKVEIQGHTDNIGGDEYNRKLSEQRAWAVVNYLVQQMGVDATRLIARGYGKLMPKASNDTPEGRALNRRVEFVVIGEVEKK